MAAQAWKIFTRAKRRLCGTSTSNISLEGVFRLCLCTSAATTPLAKYTNTGISTWASVSATAGAEISARGGYVAKGRSLPGVHWTVGTTTKQMKFTFTTAGIVFTASNSYLHNIKFAVIRNSTGAGAGKVLCWCSLSSAQFDITSPNTLTILPAATGVFTLA